MKSRRSRREAGDLVSNLRDVKLESAPLNAHPLDPRRDETVSRIVGRRETQAATLRGKAIDAMISRIATIGYAAVARRPGFQPADVAAMVAAFEEGVAACGLARSIVRTGSPATGRAIRAAIVVSTADVAEGGCARPVAIVFSVDRSRMQLTTAPAMSEWRQHVVDRLHMRAEDRGDAHAVVGHALTWSQRLLEAVGLAMDEDGRPSVVPVPVAGGLVRGLLVPSGPCQMEAVSEIEALRRGADIGSTPRTCDPCWFDPDRRPSVWRGLTYLGPGELDDRARDYAEAFEVAKKTMLALEREVADACGPDRSLLRAGRAAARGRALEIGRDLLARARVSGHGRIEAPGVLEAEIARGASTTPPWSRDHVAFWDAVDAARRTRPPRWFKVAPGPSRPGEASRKAWWEAGEPA